MKKLVSVLGFMLAASSALYAAKKAAIVPPNKLSDLHKFLVQHAQAGLAPAAKVKPVVHGRSTEIIPTGRFRKVEMELKEFDLQDLHFDRGEILLDHFWVDPKAMKKWELKVEKIGEVQTRLVFSLPSLRNKLAQALGPELKIKADVTSQELELSGRGKFLFIPAGFSARMALVWDGAKLEIKPRSLYWAGIRIPLWLRWLGSRVFPVGSILDLSLSWIPFNIQELHISWDKVTLSTNW